MPENDQYQETVDSICVHCCKKKIIKKRPNEKINAVSVFILCNGTESNCIFFQCSFNLQCGNCGNT